MNGPLRQSTVNDYMVCPTRVEHRLAYPTYYRGSVMRAAGTGYHAYLADLYETLRDGKPVSFDQHVAAGHAAVERELERSQDGFDWRYQVANSRDPEIVFNRQQLLDLVTTVSTMHSQGGYVWPTDRYTILGVEQGFLLPLPTREGLERSGTMDLIVQDTDTGWIHVVDHKLTRKKWYPSKAQPHQSVQAAWYVSAAKEMYSHEQVTFTYDVLTTSGDFNRIDAHRTDAHIAATLEAASLVADVIQRGGPFVPNTTSFLCHHAYCDWWDVCPYGKTLHT